MSKRRSSRRRQVKSKRRTSRESVAVLTLGHTTTTKRQRHHNGDDTDATTTSDDMSGDLVERSAVDCVYNIVSRAKGDQQWHCCFPAFNMMYVLGIITATIGSETCE